MSAPTHQKNDISIAHKAINLARGLSSADKAVAAALIDHYNVKTGQCDPSIERLAMLLGINEKTVRRSTNDLSGVHKLFEKRSHGGKSCRASYKPNWHSFREIVKDWGVRMRSGTPPTSDENPLDVTHVTRDERDNFERENRAEMSAVTGQKCPVEPGRNVLQTYTSNLFNQPTVAPQAQTGGGTARHQPSNSTQEKGLGNVQAGADRPPGYQASERAAPTGCSRSDAAWQAAQRRVNAAIASADPEWRHALWLVVEPEQMNRAITSEIRRRGEGIATLDAAMRLARLSAAEAGYVH